MALLGGTGCASYHEASVGDLVRQQPVRVRLSPEALARNIQFASGVDGFVGGRFIEVRGDSVTLLLTTPAAFSQVAVHRESILSLERRESSNGRSLLLSVAVVGGVAALAYLGFDGGSEGGPPPDDDVGDALRPGLRLRIPVGLN